MLSDRGGYFLVEVAAAGKQRLTATIIKGRKSARRERLVRRFLERTTGPDDELLAFYKFARKHPYLSKLVRRYRGLRLVGVVNLWECLSWSVIGQQVSVQSAFATRSRLARFTGAVVEYEKLSYEGFPTPQAISEMSAADLRQCGFSRQKADYVKGIANEVLRGSLNEEALQLLPIAEQRERLLQIKGIGPWSAEYAMMRVHGDPDACPYEDIGLRNALRSELNLSHQPSIRETESLTEGWRPFRAYATFYIWFTLLKRQ